MNLKYFTGIVLLFLFVISLSSVVAVDLDQDNNSDEKLSSWTTSSEIRVDFFNHQQSLHNGDKCRVIGYVNYFLLSVGGDPFKVYIDNQYIESGTFTTPTGSGSGSYGVYVFHDLTPGEHTLTFKYEGYKESFMFPDIEPCSYTCKINVVE